LITARKYDKEKEAMITGIETSVLKKGEKNKRYQMRFDSRTNISPQFDKLFSAGETIKNFFQKYPLLKFKKGELICRPGEKLSFIPFVKSGYISNILLLQRGKKQQ